MATSAKCGNGHHGKKQTQKSQKQKSQILKAKIKKRCPVVKLSKLSLPACLSVPVQPEKKKTMVDLKSAYVALEYKHYHNIGSRKAAEQVITYDESVPIYESRLSAQTDYNCNRVLPNANLCGTGSENGSIHLSKKLEKQKCNIDSSSAKTSPKAKKCLAKKSDVTKKKEKDIPLKLKAKKKKLNVLKILDSPVPISCRREASLNAKAKLNILYHETDPIKGLDSETDEESLNTVSTSVSNGKTSPNKTSEKTSAGEKKKQQKEKSPKKCSEDSPDKPKKECSKSPVKSKKDTVKTAKSPSLKRKAEAPKPTEGPKYARRMASLNAEAIMAVTGSSMQTNTQKAARTEMLEAARTQVYVSPKKDLGRWVEGRGDEFIKAMKNHELIQWSNRDIIKDVPVKDGTIVPNTDPLKLSDNNAPPIDKPVNVVDRPLCHSYQSPIHVNVEDCGPYLGNQAHIAAPLPRYSYSPGRSVTPTAQCQSYTLAGLGSLSNVQMMPFHQTYNSAFSVPCNHNINVPCNHSSGCSLTTPYYGYVHNNYYPSMTSSGSLLQPLPEPCMIPRPHPVPVQCPQAEVKVLIHNPHTEHPFITPHDDPPLQTPIKVESLTPSLVCTIEHAEQKELESLIENSQPVPNQHETQSKPKTVKQKSTPNNKPHLDSAGEKKKAKEKCKKKSDKSSESACKVDKKKTAKPKKISDVKLVVKKKKVANEKTAKDKLNESKKDEKKKKKAVCTEGPLKVSKSNSVTGQKTDDKTKSKNCKKENKVVGADETGKSVKKDDKVKKDEKLKKDEKQKKDEKLKKDEKQKKDEKVKKKDCTGQQKEESPSKTKRKKVDNHGWSWAGEPELKVVHSPRDTPPVQRECYPAMRHCDGDEVHTGDCVLLCSGPRKSDIPYVAKVTNLWENGEDGEMMMSLLWYYRPEHTETGRLSHHMDCEVFASKHRDENSVACIEDKCYVLTYNEYCRYRGDLRYTEEGCYRRPRVVPESEDGYFRSARLPPLDADPEIVLLCRQVYDFRQKRILKNPS